MAQLELETRIFGPHVLSVEAGLGYRKPCIFLGETLYVEGWAFTKFRLNATIHYTLPGA